jgi:hypothetical protein
VLPAGAEPWSAVWLRAPFDMLGVGSALTRVRPSPNLYSLGGHSMPLRAKEAATRSIKASIGAPKDSTETGRPSPHNFQISDEFPREEMPSEPDRGKPPLVPLLSIHFGGMVPVAGKTQDPSLGSGFGSWQMPADHLKLESRPWFLWSLPPYGGLR